jgi:hypothetical protein
MNNKSANQTGSSNASSKVAIIKMILDSIVESIEEAGEFGAPGGVLYAALMAHGCTLNQFHSLMGILINSGKVELRGECYFKRA